MMQDRVRRRGISSASPAYTSRRQEIRGRNGSSASAAGQMAPTRRQDASRAGSGGREVKTWQAMANQVVKASRQPFPRVAGDGPARITDPDVAFSIVSDSLPPFPPYARCFREAGGENGGIGCRPATWAWPAALYARLPLSAILNYLKTWSPAAPCLVPPAKKKTFSLSLPSTNPLTQTIAKLLVSPP